ncbi:MAG: PQQ-dependent sugar dehydrogenase [Alphaproteobacteria bacterium]|nr:PQQ-dependent sugar dehydrogenase [Alphaproteobacteria bacterium]
MVNSSLCKALLGNREFSQHARPLRVLLLAAWLSGFAAAGQTAELGERIQIDRESLPAPYAEPSHANGPERIPRPQGASLKVPAGFTVRLFADGLVHARWLCATPDGDVFLAEPNAGEVTLLRDRDGDGRAEFHSTYLEGLRRPHGLAFREGVLYVADTERVWRVSHRKGATKGTAEPITPPGELGAGSGHWTRNLALHPDGTRFFVAIGSRGNLGEEPEPRATIREFPITGGPGKTFAAGLRNPVGIAFYPGTEDLYTVVNERDGSGDELVPDYLTRVRAGEFYGWPYAYLGPNPEPRFAALNPALVAKTKAPDLLFRSHSAPLGLVFYDGVRFPETYRGDAFVALHGSWNAGVPRGYMVVRVPFENGQPQGWYEPFVTGFRIKEKAGAEERARVWGRPSGLALLPDGSLLIADDVGNRVWRVAYEGADGGP